MTDVPPPPPPWEWRPPPPPPLPPPRVRWVRPLLAGAGVVVGVGAVALLGGSARETDTRYPAAWDPRVASLVEFVESERGGPFGHPVFVDFLTADEYSDRTRIDEGDIAQEDADSLARTASVFRALGVAQGELDLLAAGNDIGDTGTLAFYDPAIEVVVVRGTEMTTDLDVTLVHELTHVWQDQRFDLERGFESSPHAQLAVRGLFEGDAIRVEEAYLLDVLSPAERAVYDERAQAGFDEAQAGLADVPRAFQVFFDAPYAFGIPFVLALEATGGGGVDAAFEDLPTSDEQLVDPLAYLEDDERVDLQPPAVPEGAELLDDEGGLGSVALYLALAERMDAGVALTAVDGWGGDAQVLYRLADRTCIRVTVRTDTPADAAELRDALGQWSAAVPGGAVVVTFDGETALIEACDPGPAADLGVTGRGADAFGLPVARSHVFAGLVGEPGADPRRASCVADRAVRALTIEQLNDPTGAVFADGTFAAALTAAREACGAPG